MTGKGVWRSRGEGSFVDWVWRGRETEAFGLRTRMGYLEEDLATKPHILVANSWGETTPGHNHLRELGKWAKAGIWAAGGVPFEFNVYALCAGWANFIGHRINWEQIGCYILAFEIETAIGNVAPDALLCLGTCDENIPAALLAAARADIPTIIVPGGCYIDSLNDYDTRTYQHVKAGELCEGCITLGGCGGFGTCNTGQCLAEVLGMTLPRGGSIPAIAPRRRWIAMQSGKQIMKLWEQDIKPSDIMTKEAIENAIVALNAIGGSTNAVLHLLALARALELDDEITIDTFDTISRTVPCICDVSPGGKHMTYDFDEAGGIPALLKTLDTHINLSVLTATGKTLEENIKHARVLRDNIIYPLTNPRYPPGGIVVLRGNLATSSISRPSCIPTREMFSFEGPAKVFDEWTEARDQAIPEGEVKLGDIVVLRYAGSRGGPGLPDCTTTVAQAMQRMGLETGCWILTDGRVSGLGGWGASVVQISPEAAVGGPIAIVKDGDRIQVNIEERQLNVKLSDQEIQSRLAGWKRPPMKVKKGVLKLWELYGLPPEKGGGIV